MRKLLCAGLFLLTLLPLTAQTKDPLIGTWLLDLTKSSYDPGPPPDGARTMVFEAVDNGFKHTTRTKTQNNGAFDIVIEYTAKYDGKDYRMDPEATVDMVSLKRIDKNTVERTGKVRGMVAETVTFKVSPDGKALTVTTKGTYQGNEYSSMQVFDRQ
jgi:hypothetical protein